MKIQDLILAPLSWLYGIVISIRNGLYKADILHSHTVSIPTIAVGNLAVGGTGKTPFVEYLIRMLSPHYNVAVLSLGYKRRTRGFVMADENATALTIGDEPMQIHQKFPSIPVAVCKDRIHGIHCLQQQVPNLQVVILDDAFQYRRLRCGFYILLTAYDRLYIDDHFLPLGRLRDNKHESLRASAPASNATYRPAYRGYETAFTGIPTLALRLHCIPLVSDEPACTGCDRNSQPRVFSESG